MENKKIDFVVYEASMNRLERTNKRQFILNIILIIVLFLSYAGIIVYSMLPSETYEANQTVTGFDSVENSHIENGK